MIELLIVIAILASLMTMLMPALARAKGYVRARYCLTNLRGIGQGLVMYQTENADRVVPSFNMPRTGTFSMSAGDVVDGWPAILERNGLVPGSSGLMSNIFYCPDTVGVDGMAGGQTGYDQIKPSGYQDWPVQFVTGGGDGATKTDPNLPIAGFGNSHGLYEKNIRCGYYLNAYNPIGTAPSPGPSPECAYYTHCVGFGPYTDGSLMPVVPNISRPYALIVACDGMYMGRQSVTRLGEQNRRIGYRHPGRSVKTTVNGVSTIFSNTVTNAVFADGHVAPISNNDFPHGNVPSENSGPYSLLAAD